jgi:hypothetical protein
MNSYRQKKWSLAVLFLLLAIAFFPLTGKADTSAKTVPVKVEIPSGYSVENGYISGIVYNENDVNDWISYNLDKNNIFQFSIPESLNNEKSKIKFIVNLRLIKGEDRITYYHEYSYTKDQLKSLSTIPLIKNPVIVDAPMENGIASLGVNYFLNEDSEDSFNGKKIMIAPGKLISVANITSQNGKTYILKKEINITKNTSLQFDNEMKTAIRITLMNGKSPVSINRAGVYFNTRIYGGLYSETNSLKSFYVTPGNLRINFGFQKGKNSFEWQKDFTNITKDTTFQFTNSITSSKIIDSHIESDGQGLVTKIEVKSGDLSLKEVYDSEYNGTISIKLLDKNNNIISIIQASDIGENMYYELNKQLNTGKYKIIVTIPEYNDKIQGELNVPKVFKLINFPKQYDRSYFNNMNILEVSKDGKSITSSQWLNEGATLDTLKIDQKKQYIILPSFSLINRAESDSYTDMIQLSGESLLKLDNFHFNKNLVNPKISTAKLNLKNNFVDLSTSIKGYPLNFALYNKNNYLPSYKGTFSVSMLNNKNQLVYISKEADLKKTTNICLDSDYKKLITVKIKTDKKSKVMYLGIKNSLFTGWDNLNQNVSEMNYLIQPGKYQFIFSTSYNGDTYHWLTKEYTINKVLNLSFKPSSNLALSSGDGKIIEKNGIEFVKFTNSIVNNDLNLFILYRDNNPVMGKISLVDKKGTLLGKRDTMYLNDLSVNTNKLKAGNYTLKIEIPSTNGKNMIFTKNVKINR